MNIRTELGALAKLIYGSLIIIVGILALFEKATDQSPMDTARHAVSTMAAYAVTLEEQSQPVSHSTITVEKVETTPAIQLTKKVGTLPRGVRNNNPLNIRVGNDWQGERTVQTDGAFEEFESSAYGFRAAAKTIRTYQRKYGLKTINDIVSRFAPPSENNTSNYAKFVAKKMGIDVNAPINVFNDDVLLAELLHAMSIIEVGRHYSYTDAYIGVALANGHTLES